ADSLNKAISIVNGNKYGNGAFITLYTIELARSHIMLSEQVKRDVPSLWDPAALADFIDKYGNHVVVGVKMGGKDVISYLAAIKALVTTFNLEIGITGAFLTKLDGDSRGGAALSVKEVKGDSSISANKTHSE
ncbi:hypothetical protein Dimus_005623, partial [Dionaea muscipula]